MAILTANLIRQLREQNKQERLSKQNEAKIRQQVLQELNAAGCLKDSARLNPLVRDTFQLSHEPAPKFGMALGESVWNPLTGKKNEQGLSTAVSNGDDRPWSDVGRTQKEREYLEAKNTWKDAKDKPGTSEEEKARLKAKKQELKPGAKASKKKAGQLNTVLSLGTSAIPGPLGTAAGFATKPVASTLVDLAEGSKDKKTTSRARPVEIENIRTAEAIDEAVEKCTIM